MLLKLFVLGVFALLSMSVKSEQLERLSLFTYHNKPPYIESLADKKGLYFDIVNLLNEFQPKLQYELVLMSKEQIRQQLERNTLAGAVLGVNPLWFDDVDQQKFVWSDPLFYDTDEFVSSIKKPFDYQSQASLHGKKYGGVEGYYYPKLAEAERREKLTRVDAKSEKELLELILQQKLDFAVVSRPTFFYFAKKNGWWTSLSLSHQSHQKYYRAILIPKDNKYQFGPLQKTTGSLPFKKYMKELVSSYHIPE
ncbi:transporter substrate-binding domain-containing protein [Pseudoalteromonas luteoviolacea]|uniref:transporter substrate-binding domain-containing protein n=1 Tax=Pseudoalteromonas luteoviolacea TaxID=43657 RepID=UPI001F1C7458|nr:transporter substrate-binding domain-containing protein [Pseudoalteromonas luteoviolacea]MCF6438663.1 transporter substrate-binding domain-containing protein [Pseudoalteromonas luteoviolacea]